MNLSACKKTINMPTKTKFIKIILVIVVLVFVAVGYLFLTGKIGQKNEAKEESVNSEVSSVETSDWKTYKNEKYGFEVEYPANIFQLNKDANTLSHTLKNFHKYSMKDGSDLGSANDISIIFKKENDKGCNWLETELDLRSLGVAFEFKNIKGVKYETGAEGEGVIYYCVKNKDNQNVFLIERWFLNASYSTDLSKQNDYIDNEKQEEVYNQILSTFKFTD